jgi:hypothetical protein
VELDEAGGRGAPGSLRSDSVWSHTGLVQQHVKHAYWQQLNSAGPDKHPHLALEHLQLLQRLAHHARQLAVG